MVDIESVAGVRGEREKEFVLEAAPAGRVILPFFVIETKITIQTVSVTESDTMLTNAATARTVGPLTGCSAIVSREGCYKLKKGC